MALPRTRCSSHREQRERCFQLCFLEWDSSRPQYSCHPLSHAPPVRAPPNPSIRSSLTLPNRFPSPHRRLPQTLFSVFVRWIFWEARQQRLPRIIMSIPNDGRAKSLCAIITIPHKLAYSKQRVRERSFMQEQGWERWSTPRRWRGRWAGREFMAVIRVGRVRVWISIRPFRKFLIVFLDSDLIDRVVPLD